MAACPTEAVLRTAQTMAIDQVTGEVATAFAGQGIRSVLLKGPAIARWLYPDGGRGYVDTDLLIDPADGAPASDILAALGFSPDARDRAWHPAVTWYRRDPGSGTRFSVDLHRSLCHVEAAPEVVWSTLSADTVPLAVAGVDVAVLAIPARAAHIALHAVQHGGSTQTLEDLRRAVATVSIEDWRRSVVVARGLGAEDCLGAGLRLLPEGQALADALGITRQARPCVGLTTSTNSAQCLQQLADVGSLRDRVAMVRDVVLPPPAHMRLLSPLARRGRLGLRLAYLGRPLRLGWRLPQALRRWRVDRWIT